MELHRGNLQNVAQLGKTGEQSVHKRSAQTVVALGVPPMMFPGLERPYSSKSLTHRATSTTACYGAIVYQCISTAEARQATCLSGIAGRTSGTTGTAGAVLGSHSRGAS